MTFYRIVETDNHGSDYPDEKFVFGLLTKQQAETLAKVINETFCPDDYAPRFWKIVESPYELQPGFEP